MKKILSVLVCTIAVITAMSFSVSAESQEEILLSESVVVSQTVEELPNGFTVIDTITEHSPQEEYYNYSATAAASTYTKSGSRTVTIKNGSSTLFSFTVHGSFSVNPGVSATCTSVSSSYSITETAWKYDYATTSKSGNKATANGYFYKKILFITVDNYTANVTLSCDVNGNLS